MQFGRFAMQFGRFAMPACLAAMVFWGAATAHADFCVGTGGPSTVHSADGNWRLIFEERKAALDRKRDGRWRRAARWQFVNDYGPSTARVANDGTVVTFDNICRWGKGKNVVVFYRPDGMLVRSLTLADLLVETDVAALRHTVSSIHWSGEHRIDDSHGRLVLEVKGPAKTFELPVSLATGELLVPKKRHFEVAVFYPVVRYDMAEEGALDGRPCEGGTVVSSYELLSRIATQVVPEYPAVARKARISGDVVLDLAVSDDGSVTSVDVKKAMPFGIDEAAVAAARGCRFRPGPKVCGRLVMKFGIRKVHMPE